MRKSIFLIISVLIVGFIIYLLIDKHNLKSEGNVVIDKIEMFKQKNKRLPNSLNELGVVSQTGALQKGVSF
ncbi:hypothetical protein [Ascidiimonas aurantiaca]|uniref:hypothetical protein n=1 Tax=Ascidiimonas aurantiaca TaxID=1685432 RepID=UPI0030EF7E5E